MRNERRHPREGRPALASIANLNAPPSRIWRFGPLAEGTKGNPGRKAGISSSINSSCCASTSHRRIGRFRFLVTDDWLRNGLLLWGTAKAPLGGGTGGNGASGDGKSAPPGWPVQDRRFQIQDLNHSIRQIQVIAGCDKFKIPDFRRQVAEAINARWGTRKERGGCQTNETLSYDEAAWAG